MVYHSVTKIGYEYFSFDGLIDDKGDGAAGLITAVIDISPQLDKTDFIVSLKSQCIEGVAFILAAIEIYLKVISKMTQLNMRSHTPISPGESDFHDTSQFHVRG